MWILHRRGTGLNLTAANRVILMVSWLVGGYSDGGSDEVMVVMVVIVFMVVKVVGGLNHCFALAEATLRH